MIPEFLFIAAALVVALASFAVLRQDKAAFASNLRTRIEALRVHVKQYETLLKDTGKAWARHQELSQGCITLQQQEDRLKEDIAVLQPKAAVITEEVAGLNAQKSALDETVKSLEEEKRLWEDRIKELDRLDEVTAESLKKQKEIDEQISEAEGRIKALSTQLEEAQAAEQKLSDLQTELTEVTEKKAALEKELEQLRTEKKEIEETVEKSKKELEDLERSRKMLESVQVMVDGGGGTNGKGTALTRSTFATLFEPEFTTISPVTGTNLDHKLDGFCQALDEHDFHFPNRLVKAFHTALKVQDVSCLTVMAGISGTGKSALPRLYADYMGMHSLIVPVEPRWDSPQDLFGFLNYMENRYEATPLGRALTQFNIRDKADQSPMNDQVLMVLLDEMNLARVEYYFSEFLSRLETRRDVDWQGDLEAYQKVSMEIFAGEKTDEGARTSPIRLFAGPNVLFVGTMNEDESTQSLTDKVIDRSNAIHFGRPETLKARVNGGNFPISRQKVSYSSWRDIIQSGLLRNSAAADAVDGYLRRLNSAFDDMGRSFGHRSYAATCAYIANHPDGLTDELSEMPALADQIAMRFLPKLRGIDLRENRETLDRVGAMLGELNDSAVQKAFKHARDENRGYFHWRGIDWNAS